MDKNGRVYGINHEQKMFVRDGVSSSFPAGTKWRHIPSPPALAHISAGYSKVVVLDSAGAIYIYHGEFTLAVFSEISLKCRDN